MIYLGFVPILEVVFRPQIQAASGVHRTGRDTRFRAVRWWPVVVVLGSMSWGCLAAPTPMGPPPPGSSNAPPAVTTFPGQDTTVDSIGLMPIEVIVRDQNTILTVTVELSGTSSAFPADTVRDTVFDAVYTVLLAPLRHQPFSFRVAATDLLGRETVTDSIVVRLK